MSEPKLSSAEEGAERVPDLPTRQATLVAWYGEKDDELRRFIADVQKVLAKALDEKFEPYAEAQVHATIIGLETAQLDGRRIGANFFLARDIEHEIDPARVLELVRDTPFLPLTLRIGGHRPDAPPDFVSRGEHPYVRSFGIRGDAAVAMGWPAVDGAWNSSLDDLRREFRAAGFLHKWHAREDDVDNDGYFVLGRAAVADIPPEEIARVEKRVRERLAEHTVDVPLRREDLSVVTYEDVRLPLETSRAWRVADLSAGELAKILAADAEKE